jgi:predicted GNAT family acetyltransferase/glutaredoxin
VSAPRITLYQAEWCPFSSAVREVLTELGIDVVLRQVEPFPKQRDGLREVAGTDAIPVLETEDGRVYRGTREIFAHLRRREPWRYADAHHRRFVHHRDARESDVPGQLVEYFRGGGELEAFDASRSTDELAVVPVPESHRYELMLHGRRVGLLAYRRRGDRIAFTHTEVDESCERRGFGSRLVAGALDDARAMGLKVVPLCPFVAYVVEQHPEYQPLVADEHRAAGG